MAMDDYFDPLGKWRREMEALDPLKSLRQAQTLLSSPLYNLREQQKLEAAARGNFGLTSLLGDMFPRSVLQIASEKFRIATEGLGYSVASGSPLPNLAAMIAGASGHLELQDQIRKTLEPITVAGVMNDAYATTFGLREHATVSEAISGSLGSITSAITALQSPFTIESIAKLMSVDTAMIEAAHAYLAYDDDELKDGDHEVLDAAKKVVSTLNENTVKRVHEMSWFEVAEALAYLIALIVQYQLNLQDELHQKTTEQTLAQVEDNTEEIAKLRRLAEESANTIEAISARAAEYERIALLPRAVAPKGATVRNAPAGAAERITILAHDQQCAVEEVAGRWVRCTYVDALSEEPRTGWIWKGSLELFD